MRLTSVVILSSYNLETIEFSVEEENAPSKYLVRQILGLDAEELIPKFYGTGIESGERFYDRSMRPRDIVMRVAINPNYSINESVSDIRDKIYRLISASRTGMLQLQFKDAGTFMAVINGMVTKMEVPYFTKLPELQITVNCPDPIFRSISPVSHDPADIETTNPIRVPDNASTAPHGLSFRVKFTSAAADFIIQDKASSPDWLFRITPTGGFAVDDELVFSSEYGNKQVYIDTLSGPVHLLDKISEDSIWPVVFPGDNDFYFIDLGDFDWMGFSYYSAYWGL
jgi:hypothetical protein